MSLARGEAKLALLKIRACIIGLSETFTSNESNEDGFATSRTFSLYEAMDVLTSSWELVEI